MRLWSWVRDQSSVRVAAIVGLMCATGIVYAPSSLALAGFWTDTADRTYTHGFLVLLISLWLLVRDRRSIDAAPAQPVSLALPVLLVLSAAWLYFWRAVIQDAHLLLLPILTLTAVLATFGWRVARLAAFPLLFLDFAMPVWSDLVDPLQHLSVDAVGVLIWLTGLPAYMQGNIIHLPAGSLEIAEGCSGMHFLIVGLAMATLYGKVMRDPPRKRLLWVGLMGAFALIANWVRIFAIAVAGYATDMRSYLITVDHYWFGWGVFAVFFAGFLWLAGRLSPPPSGLTVHRSEILEPAGEVTFRRRVGAGPIIATLTCLAVLPLLVYGADSLHGMTDPGVAIDWPAHSDGWRGPEPESSAWHPEFDNPTATSRRTYVDASGKEVELFAVAYRTQRQGGKLIAYSNSLLGRSGSLSLAGERIIESASGRWREMTVSDQVGARSIIWSRYQIGTRHFVRPRLSQLWYGIAAFRGDPVSSLVALRAACEPSCDAARIRLAAAAHLLPTFRPAATRPGETAR